MNVMVILLICNGSSIPSTSKPSRETTSNSPLIELGILKLRYIFMWLHSHFDKVLKMCRTTLLKPHLTVHVLLESSFMLKL